MINNKNCSSCIFSDKCSSNDICEHFAPVDDIDADIDLYIEKERRIFRKEWMEYVDRFFIEQSRKLIVIIHYDRRMITVVKTGCLPKVYL